MYSGRHGPRLTPAETQALSAFWIFGTPLSRPMRRHLVKAELIMQDEAGFALTPLGVQTAWANALRSQWPVPGSPTAPAAPIAAYPRFLAESFAYLAFGPRHRR